MYSDSLWLIQFYAPWCVQCWRWQAGWEEVARVLKGVVKVGVVNADQHGSLRIEFGIQHYPTFKIFGDNKSNSTDYKVGVSLGAMVEMAKYAFNSLVNDRLAGKTGGSDRGLQGGGNGGSERSRIKVLGLTDANFYHEVIQSDSLWLIQFYGPLCDHCWTLLTDWEIMATVLKDVVKVRVVNAVQHKSLSIQYGILCYPTFKIFGANQNNEDYQVGFGIAAMAEMAKYAFNSRVNDRLGGKTGGSDRGLQGDGSSGGSKTNVVELTDANFDSLVLNGEGAWLVVFNVPSCGLCMMQEHEWEAAASDVKKQTQGSVRLGAVNAIAHSGLVRRYRIVMFPTIKFFHKDKLMDYGGHLISNDIVAYALLHFSSPELLEGGGDGGGSKTDVVELTDANFDSLVLNGEGAWLVVFNVPSCGLCMMQEHGWQAAASDVKQQTQGSVRLGAVNATAHFGLVRRYRIVMFPTIKFFYKDKLMDYRGRLISNDIVVFALHYSGMQTTRFSAILAFFTGAGPELLEGGGDGGGSKTDVVELTDANFDGRVLNGKGAWLVVFNVPSCGLCMMQEHEWEAAASDVKKQTQGRVRLGAVNAIAHCGLVRRYRIVMFPTIKFFVKDKPMDYGGRLISNDIVVFALHYYSRPELLEVLNEGILMKTCGDSQLCIIFVLPSILDPGPERRAFLDVMTNVYNRYNWMEMSEVYKTTVAEEHKKKMWGWLWTEAGVQMDLEVALGIWEFGYPAMAAINMRKMTFTLLDGPFSEAGIDKFLSDLSVGSGSTEKVWVFPKINDVEAWDGKEVEEEFSSWLPEAVESFERFQYSSSPESQQQCADSGKPCWGH